MPDPTQVVEFDLQAYLRDMRQEHRDDIRALQEDVKEAATQFQGAWEQTRACVHALESRTARIETEAKWIKRGAYTMFVSLAGLILEWVRVNAASVGRAIKALFVQS